MSQRPHLPGLWIIERSGTVVSVVMDLAGHGNTVNRVVICRVVHANGIILRIEAGIDN